MKEKLTALAQAFIDALKCDDEDAAEDAITDLCALYNEAQEDADEDEGGEDDGDEDEGDDDEDDDE